MPSFSALVAAGFAALGLLATASAGSASPRQGVKKASKKIFKADRVSASSKGAFTSCSLPDMRPPAASRTFVSTAVDSYIEATVARGFKDPNLATLFSNTLPNTLDTTVFSHTPFEDTFVVTGDIPAMWLRDSTNQLQAFLPFIQKDDDLKGLFVGLLYRHARSVVTDPYANAFQLNAQQGPGPHTDDQTYKTLYAGTVVSAMTNAIFERKFEVDSLANVLRMSALYYQYSGGDTTPFTNGTLWVDAVTTILGVYRDQQQGTLEENRNGGPQYTFQRTTSQPSDSLESGRGFPVLRTGMIKTGFRASDDAAVFSFNIPENFFAAAALQAVAPLLQAVGQGALATSAQSLAAEVLQGIASFGVIAKHPVTGTSVYAYEVDGYGNQLLMDDANVPSLLALPIYFPNALNPNGTVSASPMANSTLYQNTRAAVLSPKSNPWFFQNSNPNSGASGIGGPHNGVGWVWPMALISQAMTSQDDGEIASLLAQLVASSACSGLVHESFQVNDYGSYTRPWFAWANEVFAELVMKLIDERPYLIFNQ